jgi:hypothetical protein
VIGMAVTRTGNRSGGIGNGSRCGAWAGNYLGQMTGVAGGINRAGISWGMAVAMGRMGLVQAQAAMGHEAEMVLACQW